MTLLCSSTDFENDSDLRPSPACQMLPQIQVMSLNALSVAFANNVQFSLQA